MIIAVILVVVAAVALVLILSLTVSRSLQLSKADSLAGRIQPIDVEAFRNLVSPAEREYLRRRLPPGEFRTVQRERLRAMAAYVQVAGRNAAILVNIGQAALLSPNPQTADAARQLVENGLLLRRNALYAMCRIYAALAWPDSGEAASPVLAGYERLNGTAMLLGRLQNPAAPVRISAS